jgi:hypothetical protein
MMTDEELNKAMIKGRLASASAMLDHYICMCMAHSGMTPDDDTHAEINEIAENIADAIEFAIEPLQKKIVALKDRLNSIDKSIEYLDEDMDVILKK